MASSAKVTENDTVIEIGPGKGVLTKELLFCGAKVIAIEKDDALYAFLCKKFALEIESGKLTLIHGDILDTNWEAHVARRQYKVVANIPYNITGLLMRLFLEHDHQPESITFLVQKEVADRICMRDEKTSILALSVAVFGTATYIEKVGKTLFRPSPAVDSAIIHIGQIHNPFKNQAEKEVFFEIIKKAFNGKRKKIGNTLRDYSVPESLKEKRPEKLKTNDFKQIQPKP